jgi:hypothetical protein
MAVEGCTTLWDFQPGDAVEVGRLRWKHAQEHHDGSVERLVSAAVGSIAIDASAKACFKHKAGAWRELLAGVTD